MARKRHYEIEPYNVADLPAWVQDRIKQEQGRGDTWQHRCEQYAEIEKTRDYALRQWSEIGVISAAEAAEKNIQVAKGGYDHGPTEDVQDRFRVAVAYLLIALERLEP